MMTPLSYKMSNKSSAAAEMGDHLATIDMGRKVVGAVPLFREEIIYHNVAYAEAYLPTT